MTNQFISESTPVSRMLTHSDIDLNWKRASTEWCRGIAGLFPFQITELSQKPRDSIKTTRWMFGLGSMPSRGGWLEVVLIFVLLALYAGQAAPGINETHYLTKAKHFWNPAWCPDDLFLGSAFSHFLFYITTGWLTLFCSLETYAWIGRLLCWAGFAIGWYQLVQVFSNRPGRSLLAAIIFLILMDRFHMAGEWVIGGFEAKSISYVFVLFALERYFQKNWNGFWPLMGAACAFHVVAGGWVFLALIMSSLVRTMARNLGSPRISSEEPAIQFPWVPVVVFLMLCSLGAIPPLVQEAQTSSAINQLAYQVYVHQRLPHHLLFGSFETGLIARFALLSLIWFGFAWFLRNIPSVNELNGFCGASLLISLAGLFLSGLAENNEAGQMPLSEWATSLLRFYWFRLSDFAVPLAVSIMCVRVLPRYASLDTATADRTKQALGAISIFLILIAGVMMLLERWQDPRPHADRASLPAYDGDPKRTLETQINWRKACEWIRRNTPADAVFITPNDQQTFKWYAQRHEVVNWKDIPQSGEATLEWKRRIDSLYRIQRLYRSGLMAFDNMQAITQMFGANYLLLEQMAVDTAPQNVPFKQVYPEELNKKSTYVVFQID